MFSIINRLAIALILSIVCATATAATQKTTNAKQPSALKVKQGNYSPQGKLTRRAFVEKSFGVKFGERLDQYIAFDAQPDGDGLNVQHKNLASPIFGHKEVLFFMSRSGELESIQLIPQTMPTREASLKAAKARLDKFSLAVGKWLGIKSFEPQEKVTGESAESKAWNFARVYEEDGLKVKAEVDCIETGKAVMGYDCSLTISCMCERSKNGVSPKPRTTSTEKLLAR